MIENLIEKIDFEWVELPSKGECYPHKKFKVPVGYLRAIDENIIVSSKHINSQTVCDELLRRKILDKEFNPDTLCVGDRNAILVWLRRTGYGDIVINPNTHQTIDLSSLKHKKFNLKGDENGYFNYLLDNGDMIKYRLLTHNDEQEIINKPERNLIRDNSMYFQDIELSTIIKSIVSINENTSQDYIMQYINNLSDEQRDHLLRYIIFNTPDYDFSDVIISIDDSLFSEIK